MGGETIGKAVYAIGLDASELLKSLANVNKVVKDEASKASESFVAGTQQSETKWGKFCAKLGDLTRTAVAGVKASFVSAAGAVGSFAKDSLNMSVNFDNAMSSLNYAAGATEDEMKALRTQAVALANDVELPGSTAQGAAEAMLELAKAGLSANEVIDASKGTMALASISGMDFGAATKVATGALSAFGLEADQASHVADVLAVAANSSTASVSDLGVGLGNLGATASLYGISLEETSAALAILANNGLDASNAGTSLKTALLQLQTPTKDQVAMMDQLGVNFYDSQGKFVGLNDMVKQLEESMADLSEQEQQTALSTLFGSFGINSMSVLVKEGAANLDEMTKSLSAEGAAVEMASAQSSDFAKTVDSIKNATNGVQIAMGSLMTGNGTAEDLVSSIDTLFQTVAQAVIDNAPQFIKAISALLKSIMSQLPELLKTLVPPLVQILAETLPDLVNGIIEVLLGLVNYLPQLLQTVFDVLMQLIEALILMLPEIIMAVVNSLIAILVNFLTNPQNLQRLLKAFLNLLIQIVKVLPDVIVALIDALPELIANIIAFLVDPGTILMIVDAAVQLFLGIVAAVPKILGALFGAFQGLFGTLWDKCYALFKDFAANFGEAIGGVFKNAINGVLDFIENFINAPIRGINGFISTINDLLSVVGFNIGTIPTVSLPRMYTGGIVPAVNGGMPIIAGDGGEDEWVIPESKMADLIDKINGRGDIGGGETFNFTFNGVIGTPSELREAAIQFHDAYEEVKKARFQYD